LENKVWLKKRGEGEKTFGLSEKGQRKKRKADRGNLCTELWEKGKQNKMKERRRWKTECGTWKGIPKAPKEEKKGSESPRGN